jgi:hypothetical protein
VRSRRLVVVRPRRIVWAWPVSFVIAAKLDAELLCRLVHPRDALRPGGVHPSGAVLLWGPRKLISRRSGSQLLADAHHRFYSWGKDMQAGHMLKQGARNWPGVWAVFARSDPPAPTSDPPERDCRWDRQGGIRQACPAASGLVTGGAASAGARSNTHARRGRQTYLETPPLERDGKP